MTPGYHHAIPMGKYLADPCVVPSLNSSIGRILLRESPRKAWYSHPRLNKDHHAREDTKFDIGTVAHSLLLEGVNNAEVLDFDDYRKKEAQAARDAARAAGKVPLLRKHYLAVANMLDAAQEFIATTEIAQQWADGESEVMAVCEERGVWLRCRLDRISKSRRALFDYKSTTDVSPDEFGRHMVSMGYYFQEAFYRRIVRNLGAIGPRFVFLAQSVEPPHECTLHSCDPSLQEIGDAEVERAIELWRQCVQTKAWPSYGTRIHAAIPTTWQMNQYAELLLGGKAA